MSDSVIVTANGFPDPESLPLVSDVQFREPYSSAAINRKLRGLALPGIYSGFNPTPGTGLNVLISSDDDGGTCSFNIGEYYQLSVRQQSDVTVAMAAGTTKIIALQATYALGQETYQVNSGSTVQAAEFVLLDATASLADNQLEMCKVTIPAGTTQITSDMIDLSGRVARSLTFELSSAIDSSDEEVAANSLAVKKAIAYIESEIAAAVATKLLTVTGAAMFSSTLTVAGISYFDRVRANQYVDLGYQNGTAGTRQITFYSGSDTTNTGYINVVGSSASASVMTIKAGGIYLNGSTNLTGALSVSSTLSVSGSAVFAGALTASGAATFGTTLDVTNQINSGYRINISRSDGNPPYMNFVRNDLASTATPTSDTGVLQLIARTASDTSDPYAGRNLGLISVYMTPSGGGKVYLDARNSSGSATIKLSMDSATATATLTGSLAVTSALKVGSSLTVTGTSQATADGNSFILMPATADKSYYIRGKKSDGTLHWYLGQSADSTDTVTLGNSIGGAWLTLKGDGSAASNVSTMTYSGALVAGATTVSSLASTGGMSVSATATFGYRIMMQRSGAIPYHTFTRTDITSAPSSETEIGRLVWGYGMSGTDTWGTGGVLGYMSTFAVANGGGKVNISANNSSNATGAALLLNGYTGEATVTGTLTTTGAISTPDELVSTQNGNNVRMNNGTYSVIHRNYSGQYYILLTDSGNPTGTYNSLRPFTMALSTGAITIGTALTTSSTVAVSGAASFGSSVSVSGAAALSSTLTVGGTLTASGEVISTSIHSYRMVYGNYGMFQRFDGSNWYMMFTDSGSQYGSYNSLRPIIVSATTGNVTLSATTVKGNLTATGAVYVNSGGGFLGTDGNIYGSLWGGYLSTYIANNFKTTSSTDGYQGIGSYVLARSSYGAAFAPGATISGSYLQAATSDGGYTGSTLTGTWMLMGYMTTTNDAHRTSLYQRVA